MTKYKILWLILFASILTVCLGYYFRPVVTAIGVEMRTGRAEYLQGEDPMLIIRNRGPNTVTFGYYYWLQRYQDGEWISIPFKENVGFPAWLMILEPGGFYRYRIHFVVSARASVSSSWTCSKRVSGLPIFAPTFDGSMASPRGTSLLG